MSLGANLKTFSDGLCCMRQHEGLQALDAVLMELCIFKEKLGLCPNWLRPILEELVGAETRMRKMMEERADGNEIEREEREERRQKEGGLGKKEDRNEKKRKEDRKKEREKERKNERVVGKKKREKDEEKRKEDREKRGEKERLKMKSGGGEREEDKGGKRRRNADKEERTKKEELKILASSDARDDVHEEMTTIIPLRRTSPMSTSSPSPSTPSLSQSSSSSSMSTSLSSTLSLTTDIIIDDIIDSELAVRSRILASILDFDSRYPRQLEAAALRSCSEMLRRMALQQQRVDILASIAAKSNFKKK